MSSGGSAPSVPQMSQEEKDLLAKQTQLLDQLNKVYGTSITNANEQQDILKRISGLYTLNSDGSLKLDDSAVQRQADIAKAQLDRYEKAIAGTLPVSEGTTQRKAQEFRLLQENAARRGIDIQGTSVDDATSNSTSGNELIGQFKRSYGLIEDAERRGELSGGTNSGLSILGASQSAGASNLLGAGNGLLGAYQSVSSPYANQRQLEYQGSLANYAYGQQRRGGIIGAGLSGAAIGGQLGGPWGAAGGGALGLLAGIGA